MLGCQLEQVNRVKTQGTQLRGSGTARIPTEADGARIVALMRFLDFIALDLGEAG